MKVFFCERSCVDILFVHHITHTIRRNKVSSINFTLTELLALGNEYTWLKKENIVHQSEGGGGWFCIPYNSKFYVWYELNSTNPRYAATLPLSPFELLLPRAVPDKHGQLLNYRIHSLVC